MTHFSGQKVTGRLEVLSLYFISLGVASIGKGPRILFPIIATQLIRRCVLRRAIRVSTRQIIAAIRVSQPHSMLGRTELKAQCELAPNGVKVGNNTEPSVGISTGRHVTSTYLNFRDFLCSSLSTPLVTFCPRFRTIFSAFCSSM